MTIRNRFPHFSSFRSNDADQVRSFLARRWGTSASFETRASGVPFAYRRNEVSLGPCSLAVTDSTVAMHARHHGNGDGHYMVIGADVGRMVIESDETRVVVDSSRAAVVSPGSVPSTAVISPGRGWTVAIERQALHRHLQTLLDRPVRTPIRFAPSLDLTSRLGTHWTSLVGPLLQAIDDPDHPVYRPMVAEPLCYSLMSSLLLVADHPHRDALDRPAAPSRPSHVKRAIDAIEAHPGGPHTPASLARLTGVSVRTLQQGFHRHVGVSPMTYVRHVRLSRAHDDLRRGLTDTVAEAAHRWGFTHLGRFAAQYQARYGVSPSHTLRRAGRP